ncbi:unnamed protein product [Ceutorhynchus assimilis]|uniref:Uncharacterized protein n=1 Tax=Ceutorhynchus assimilis TaxID=467358 RepID=A0A9N9MTZ7_9CUCU|nr:unnamed protein product [Ceutorhynchus assimilis]
MRNLKEIVKLKKFKRINEYSFCGLISKIFYVAVFHWKNLKFWKNELLIPSSLHAKSFKIFPSLVFQENFEMCETVFSNNSVFIG